MIRPVRLLLQPQTGAPKPLPASELRATADGATFGPWRLAGDAIAWLELTTADLPVLALSGELVVDPPHHMRALKVLVDTQAIPESTLSDGWGQTEGALGEARCDGDYRWWFDDWAASNRRVLSMLRRIAHGGLASGGNPHKDTGILLGHLEEGGHALLDAGQEITARALTDWLNGRYPGEYEDSRRIERALKRYGGVPSFRGHLSVSRPSESRQ